MVATLVYSDREDRVYCLEENHQGDNRCDLGGDTHNRNGDPNCQDAAVAGDSSTGGAHMNPVSVSYFGFGVSYLLTKFYKLERLIAQVFRAFESARGVDELFEIAELIVNPAQYLSQDDQDRR